MRPVKALIVKDSWSLQSMVGSVRTIMDKERNEQADLLKKRVMASIDGRK